MNLYNVKNKYHYIIYVVYTLILDKHFIIMFKNTKLAFKYLKIYRKYKICIT